MVFSFAKVALAVRYDQTIRHHKYGYSIMPWWKPKSCLWNELKLLTCYQILKSPKDRIYTIYDFYVPHCYPRSISLTSYPAFRIAKCLKNLESIGIIVQAKPNLTPDGRSEATEGDIRDEEEFFLQRLYHHFKEKIVGPALNEFSQEWLFHLLEAKRYNGIKKDGSGILKISEDNLKEEIIRELTAPHFFTYKLNVDRKQLKKSLTDHLSEYRQGKLRLALNGYFGYRRSQEIFEAFLSRLRRRQNPDIEFRPRQWKSGEKRAPDDFFAAFQKAYPEDYESWCAGEYEFPFIPHLISNALEGRIEITGIQPYRPKKNQQICPSEEVVFDWIIHFHISDKKYRKQRTSKGNRVIRLIEVEQSNTQHYLVYINQDYLHPIQFSKKRKSGKLLYRLAQKGSAEFASYARQYEYVQSDPKFKLFAKTDFVHAPILDRQRKKIVPHPSITFRLIKPGDPGNR